MTGRVELQALQNVSDHSLQQQLLTQSRVVLEAVEAILRQLLQLHFEVTCDKLLQSALNRVVVKIYPTGFAVFDRIEGDDLNHVGQDMQVNVHIDVLLGAPEKLGPRVEELVMLTFHLALSSTHGGDYLRLWLFFNNGHFLEHLFNTTVFLVAFLNILRVQVRVLHMTVEKIQRFKRHLTYCAERLLSHRVPRIDDLF